MQIMAVKIAVDSSADVNIGLSLSHPFNQLMKGRDWVFTGAIFFQALLKRPQN